MLPFNCVGKCKRFLWLDLKTEVRYLLLFSFCLFLFMMFFSLPTYAQTNAQNLGTQLTQMSPQQIVINIQKNIPNLMRLVTAIAYVIGMAFVISGVMQLKHVGEMRTQMSHEHHLTGPILKILVGAMLLYLPTSVHVGMSTFWANPNPYGYVIQQDQWTQFVNVCFLVVQLIGTIAFIRGLIILSHMGGGHGQQGQLSKGLTHVIGGIFCINIYQFLQFVLGTIGIHT